MRLIGLVLAVSLTLGSLGVEAQMGKVWRIGLMHVGLDHVPSYRPGSGQGKRDSQEATIPCRWRAYDWSVATRDADADA